MDWWPLRSKGRQRGQCFSACLFVTLLGQLASDNGGWHISGDEESIGPSTAAAEEPRCSVERVDARGLSQEEFLRRYAYTQPVIIYNVDYNKTFRNKCRREQLLREWEDKPVVLASANTYSYTKVETTFGDYITNILKPQRLDTPGNETLYLFGDIDQKVWKPLLDEYIQPKWTLPGYEAALSFGIAGEGTGVPFHFHGPGFGEIIHGEKRWFLLPYDKRPSFDPDKSTLDWYTNTYPRLTVGQRPLECSLRQGELIFFPDKWWHATLNTKTSVFISTFLSNTNSPSKTEL